MTGPVLDHLGKVKLELGPARDAGRQKGWRAARDENDVVWLLLDVAGSDTNTVSRDVIEGLSDQLDQIGDNPPACVVVRSAKPSGFAAGADITMLSDMTDPEKAQALLRQGHEVLDRLEALDCPTVAVVHGAALGAGFEIALACDRIIAVDGAHFAFPEVNLGLHPGLGGTFRLSDRIDTLEAMTLMLTGKTAHTVKAAKLGIADKVIEERHVANAVRAACAGKLNGDGPGLSDRAMSMAAARGIAARRMRATAGGRAPREHYPAPYALIDLWEEHHGDRSAMQDGEISSFARLLASDTARELIRVFHLRQRLKSDAADDDDIRHVHVAGAGTMGGEIATWCAIKGKWVTLFDPDPQAIGGALGRAAAICKDQHLSAIETRNALDRLIPDPAGDGVPAADLVIEAGPEDIKAKNAIHTGLEAAMRPTAILATNTSSLPLDRLAKPLRRPSRFGGLHFFNPVSKMPLVEVVSHADTFNTVGDRLAAFCTTIGKLPARVAAAPGFLVNRALTPYLLESLVLLDEGLTKEAVDTIAERFGMPMGPVELADRIGLDICLHVADSLAGQIDKPLAEVPAWFREMVEEGDSLGRKSGKGLYAWDEGRPEKSPARPEPEDGWTDRLILPMLDACVECRRKGVAGDADQIDAAMIFGAGFAPFRGGPMRYAHARGTDEIRDRLAALAHEHGKRFAPDPGWDEMG